jgi:predicted nucleic acid-binding Zn ribbon protein
MADTADYCRTCYRDISPDRMFCSRCAELNSPRSRLARIVILLGTAGVPVMFGGVLGLSQRTCLIGAAVAATAVLLHLVITLR